MKCGKYLLPAALLACACGAASLLSVAIVFPDQEARTLTVSVEITAIEPGAGASCQALLQQSAQPGDEGYAIEDQLEVAYPSGAGARPLAGIGPGRRLFYALALDQTESPILQGCTDMEKTGRGAAEVTIELEWRCRPTNGGVETCDNLDNDCNGIVDDGNPAFLCPQVHRAEATACSAGLCQYQCESGWYDANRSWSDGCECHPTRGGVEWCDDLDNDCDGLTDGAGCRNCATDLDCADAGACLDDACTDGRCSASALPDGTSCQDGLYCTVDDACDHGVCSGAARDCRSLDDECNRGVCDEEADACVARSLADGTRCDDGRYCTVDDSCLTGACGGVARDCSSLDEPCRLGVCNEDGGRCEAQARLDGTACDDGLFCTVSETCQRGECTGTERECSSAGGSCATGECDEEIDRCTGDPYPSGTGCVDDLYCTVDEACDGAGNCVGWERVCPDPPPCQESYCDEADDACANRPLQDGSACPDDGVFCNGTESCRGGTCVSSGNPCPGPDGDGDCSESCNEVNDDCSAPDVAGSPCDDGIGCTQDACDGSGGCSGTPDHGVCAPDFCLPNCSDDANGCVGLESIEVDCQDTSGSTVNCLVTTNPPLSLLADCLACEAHIVEPIISFVDFEANNNPGNCDLEGWQPENASVCGRRESTCPLGDWGTSPCCNNPFCPVETAPLLGRLALEYLPDRCPLSDVEIRLFLSSTCAPSTGPSCASTWVIWAP